MENKNYSVLYYSLGAVVFIIVIVLMFWFIAKGKNAALVGDLDQKVDQEITIPAGEIGNGTTAAKKPVTPSISYADALVKYKNSRIQLDETCQAIPNNVTYKNNTYVMVDNRSASPRSIKLGADYTVRAYGFRLIKLSSDTLPATFLLDCGNSQNVATILIQK
ncbi:MAG: hypothetical protein NDI62_00030 [Burkholderiales bacterium]|nr:hypothetical protein [Burkholderiales bacterium]